MNESAKRETEIARLRSLSKALEARHQLSRTVRDFFRQHSYLEVNTPVQIKAPALEEHIDCSAAAHGYWLRPSPELHMKRLLAALNRPIFQLGPCFRAEERGSLHLPEFHMLEWYRPEADCMDILEETKFLIRTCDQALEGFTEDKAFNRKIDFSGEWMVVNLDTAFAEYTEMDMDSAMEQNLFEQVLVERILPQAEKNRPLVLCGFPLTLDSLARKNPDSGRAERWELYVNGMELANAYTELTDYHEQKHRFQQTAEIRRRQGREVYPVDVHYLETLRCGLPECGGIALGFDRLLMALLGCDNIEQITPFPPEKETVEFI